MAEYAKIIKDSEYTKNLCNEFDSFFKNITKGLKHKKLKPKALPHRLQNVSAMISLLTDFYELTENKNILTMPMIWQMAYETAKQKDGSYRSFATHYTCVIYPAKSMLELAVTERNAGLSECSKIHFSSARKAIRIC